MKNKKFVIIATQPWDIEIGSNCKNIAMEFAKTNTVLYVNAPLDLNNFIRRSSHPWVKRRIEVIRKKRKALEEVQPNLWVLQPDFVAASINWIPNNLIHDTLNKINSNKLAKSIWTACKELGITDFIIFNDSMMIKGFYMKELLKPIAQIYYVRDNLVTEPFFRRHGARLEAQLLAKSDLVLTNSLYLEEYAKKYNPESYTVGQGCEVESFFLDPERKIPEELKAIPKPIIGYVGVLTSVRLDLALIESIARKQPGWSIVLVGPEDNDFINSDLHHYRNVYFLGKRRPDQLPHYVQFFDVCINPQALNKMTIGNYPRKIDEYLAMGKPVVATLTKAMEYFKDYCSLANNDEEYIEKIKEELETDSEVKRAERVKYAMSHSWPLTVNYMYRKIAEQIKAEY